MSFCRFQFCTVAVTTKHWRKEPKHSLNDTSASHLGEKKNRLLVRTSSAVYWISSRKANQESEVIWTTQTYAHTHYRNIYVKPFGICKGVSLSHATWLLSMMQTQMCTRTQCVCVCVRFIKIMTKKNSEVIFDWIIICFFDNKQTN